MCFPYELSLIFDGFDGLIQGKSFVEGVILIRGYKESHAIQSTRPDEPRS